MANRTTELTPKQIHFSRAIVSGCTMSDAYREAYNAANMKPASIHREAHTLMADPKITARVERLQRQKDRAVVATGINDREMVLTKLRDFMENATPADAAKIRAAELLGKSVGLFSEVIVNKSEIKTIDEIDREIANRMAELDAELKVKH